MRVYKIDDGERHWVVAASTEDALAVMGETYDDPIEDVEIVVEPGDKLLSINDDDGPVDSKTTKPCAQWALENGRGLLCSTCW